MQKPRRELKNIAIAAKVTSTIRVEITKKCEQKGISMSEYLNRLIKKDLKL